MEPKGRPRRNTRQDTGTTQPMNSEEIEQSVSVASMEQYEINQNIGSNGGSRYNGADGSGTGGHDNGNGGTNDALRG
ncbi:hypothetical protein L1987_64457 [Smallanthus sonchifolius]|uniref:Uncharacterized protein n=1 Tax=Smallanthus sonchifolius TaxID=185202 RepID=A0ACB9CG36_9ASTR|nr:hypothetical protein L1987_64457 [Smallanthus sonchifolius]